MDGDQQAWDKAPRSKRVESVARPKFISPEYGLFAHSLSAWRGAHRHAALTGKVKDYEHAKVLYQITMERFRAVQARNEAERDKLRGMLDTIRRELHIAKGRAWPK